MWLKNKLEVIGGMLEDPDLLDEEDITLYKRKLKAISMDLS